jgi:hypothetical protein
MTPPTQAPHDRPPGIRRRIPVSIWLLLSFVVSGVLWNSARVSRQSVAIKEIERVQGKVFMTQPQGPEWLRRAIGKEWSEVLLEDVVSLNLADSEVTDDSLAYLKGLPNLERLWVNRTKVSDAGMVHLAGLTKLKELGLQGSRVGDEGMHKLTRLTNLEVLFVSQMKLTDAGMIPIREFKQLRTLSLEETRVTDAGLVHLSNLKQLQRLLVGGSRITKSGIAELKRDLPNVEVSQ